MHFIPLSFRRLVYGAPVVLLGLWGCDNTTDPGPATDAEIHSELGEIAAQMKRFDASTISSLPMVSKQTGLTKVAGNKTGLAKASEEGKCRDGKWVESYSDTLPGGQIEFSIDTVFTFDSQGKPACATPFPELADSTVTYSYSRNAAFEMWDHSGMRMGASFIKMEVQGRVRYFTGLDLDIDSAFLHITWDTTAGVADSSNLAFSQFQVQRYDYYLRFKQKRFSSHLIPVDVNTIFEDNGNEAVTLALRGDILYQGRKVGTLEVFSDNHVVIRDVDGKILESHGK